MNWQEEFEAAMLALGTIVPDPIEYRIHYDSTGRITMCSMQQHPSNTEYLVVDKDKYDNYAKYRVNVTKKKLEKVVIDPGMTVQLKRSSQGYKVVKHHAGLILESNEEFKDIEYYESNS